MPFYLEAFLAITLQNNLQILLKQIVSGSANWIAFFFGYDEWYLVLTFSLEFLGQLRKNRDCALQDIKSQKLNPLR